MYCSRFQLHLELFVSKQRVPICTAEDMSAFLARVLQLLCLIGIAHRGDRGRCVDSSSTALRGLEAQPPSLVRPFTYLCLLQVLGYTPQICSKG